MKSHNIPVEISNKKAKNKHGVLLKDPIVYPYMEDKGGNFCYKCRYNWDDFLSDKGYDKTFRTYHMVDGKVKNGFPRSNYYPLFRADELAEIDKKTIVVLVEGEKAALCYLAELAESQGCFFTCAISVKKTDYSKLKQFKDVVIIPDNDEIGFKNALELKAILPHARIISPPDDLPEKGDIADLVWDEGLDLYIDTAEDYVFDNGEKERMEVVINSIDSYTFEFTLNNKIHISTSEEAKQFTILKEHKQAADLVTLAFMNNVLFCEAEKKFFYFNGNVWNELIGIIDAVLCVIYDVSKIVFIGKNNKEMISVLKNISKKGYADAVIGILKQKHEIHMKQIPWNHQQAGKWILKDEVITLSKTGKIIGRKGKPEEYFNNPLPYTKDEIINADEPERYLKDLKIYFPDDNTRRTGEYILAIIFSGDIGFKKIPILVGLSDTGKSTLLKSLGNSVFPGLFDSIPAEVICPAFKKYDSGESPSPQLVKLIDHRVLGVFEIEQNRRAATGLLKTISGGDPITARRLRENPITFNPSAYIVLCTNYLPSFTGGDAAFCNRLIILPFTNPIPLKQQRTQEEIAAEFKEEAAGILKRMIRHYKELVLDHNRQIPESDQCKVRKKKYIKNNDDIGLFISTCLVIDMDDEEAVERLDHVAILYRAFFSLSEKEAKNSKISKDLINRMEEIESGRIRDKSSKKLVGVLRNIKIREEYRNIMFSSDEENVAPDEYKISKDPRFKSINPAEADLFAPYN